MVREKKTHFSFFSKCFPEFYSKIESIFSGFVKVAELLIEKGYKYQINNKTDYATPYEKIPINVAARNGNIEN